jgi:hypothetical protein
MVTTNRYLKGLIQKGSASSTEDRAEGPLAKSKVRNEPWSGLNSWDDGKLPPLPNAIRHNISHKRLIIPNCCIYTSFIKQTPSWPSNMTKGFHKYTKHNIFFFTVYRCFYNAQCPVSTLSDSLCTTLHKDRVTPSYSKCSRYDMLVCIRNPFVMSIPQTVCYRL